MKRLPVFLALTMAGLAGVQAEGLEDRRIVAKAVVAAPVDTVWQDWTTTEGLKSFFAEGSTIDLKPHGAYELYMALSAPEGSRGSEGARLLAVEPQRMLSFEWTNPPHMPLVRADYTHVTLYFEPAGEGGTSLTLIHDGFGLSPAWDEALAYFEKAWPMVLSWQAAKYGKD